MGSSKTVAGASPEAARTPTAWDTSHVRVSSITAACTPARSESKKNRDSPSSMR